MFHSLSFPARNKSTGGSKPMPRNSASRALSIYGHSQVHCLITPNLLSSVLNFGISTKSPPSKGGVGPLPKLRWNWGIQKPVLIPRSSHLESCWRKSNFFSSSVSFNMVGIVRENPHTVWSRQSVCLPISRWPLGEPKICPHGSADGQGTEHNVTSVPCVESVIYIFSP